MLEERGTKGHTEKKGLFDMERRRCGKKERKPERVGERMCE